ncbi:MAG: glycosyltransferase family 4 protein [Francisella sp.]
MYKKNLKDIDVIAVSFGKRFSGINASMLAVIPEQAKLVNIVGMGFHLNSKEIETIRFRDFLFKCWRDKWRIWHARRNIDMLIGIILRYVFRYKIKLLFTSASQRKLTNYTKFLYTKMDSVIATTISGGKFLESKYDVVYHGIDTSKFKPLANNIVEKKIGFINRIRKQKGAENFIDAVIKVLPKYPNWSAELYGETTPNNIDFEKKLKDKVKNAGLENRILFKGFINYNDIPKIYQTCSILTCLSHVEGFGLPCLEAMASKCAVIATKTGVWKEIIEDGKNGYLVDCNSSEQVAEKLEILMSDDDLRHQIAQNGYNLVTSKYTIQKEAEGIQKVYDKLLSNI